MISGIFVCGLGAIWLLAIWNKRGFLLGAIRIKWGPDAVDEKGVACLDLSFSIGCIIVGLVMIAINYGG